MTNPPTHQGPHPDHGGLTTHIGARENCSAPDCGPPDPEEEIREAVLLLDDCTAPMPPSIDRLLAKLLHEIAEDWGPQLDRRQAIHEAAHKIATSIGQGRQCDAADDFSPEREPLTPTTPDTKPADYTDAETAFMQLGNTPMGARVELHIWDQHPIVCVYRGVGMRRDKTGELMIIVSMITFTDQEHPTPAVPQPPAMTRPDLSVRPDSGARVAALSLELSFAAKAVAAHLEDPELTPPPWLSMDRGDRLVHAGPDHDRKPPMYVVGEPMPNGANADYIALMHPGLGSVLAKWLMDSAAQVLQVADLEAAEESLAHALAAARLINSRPR